MVIGIIIIVSFFDWVYVEEAAEGQTNAASFSYIEIDSVLNPKL
jgi:predicted negative regulator of RcsB-dependent stress response